MLSGITYVHGGLFSSEEEWIHPSICIDTTELIVMVKGEAHLREDSSEFHLSAGDYLFFEPGRLHSGTQKSLEEVSFYWFHFNGKLPEGMWPQMASLSERNKVEMLCRQLLHYANTPAYHKEASDYCLRLLLLEVELQSRQSSDGNLHFSEICEWIRLNSDCALTSKMVAEQFGYHEDYLARLFRRYLKCSMKQYIIKMRISYLKNQLLATDLSLKEIAYKAGFKEYKYFLKYFTMYEGITPTTYRNLYFNTHKNKK